MKEIRALELAENVERLDLTPAERSRKLVAEAEDETGEKLRRDGAVSRGGRGKRGGSRAATRATGKAETTLRRARTHVEAFEKYPVLKGGEWSQNDALAAAKALDELPKEDRRLVVAVISEPGVEPKKAVRIFTVQKRLGKEAQLAAAEIVRLAERGLGLAIRKAQQEGRVSKRGGRPAQNSPREDFSKPADLLGSGKEATEVYAMTDDVSDEEFSESLAEGKAEGKLSRANVLRKVRGKKKKRPEVPRAQGAEVEPAGGAAPDGEAPPAGGILPAGRNDFALTIST